MNYIDKYNLWVNKVDDKVLADELKTLNEKQIEDAFYKDLTFGTGGLRGIIGVGTNRLNIYTVAKASQGLANYLKKNFNNPSVVIGYDTRINSDLFSKVAAKVFAYNKINVNIYSNALPVPMVSFATREMKTSAGVMITASHNPSIYNGYKVYGSDGCQITTEVAKAILEEINKIDEFDVQMDEFDNNELINFIDESIIDKYIQEVKNQSFIYDDEINKNIKVVYTPLNGTGYKPVTRVLDELGYKNIIVVEKQKDPDGNFPTCPYPNPEVKEALELGIKCALENDADILIGTDPDCDRVGVAIKDNDDFTILSGNQVGVLLFNYICEQRLKHHKMPNNPVLIKTIVSTDLADKIANHYNVETINVLTGYKFIGEQMGLLEKDNREDDMLFSFEESDGYLSSTYVRDKDGVNGASLVCEMFAYYKTRNITLKEKLEEIYKKYGYYFNELKSYQFEGVDGFNKMNEIMANFRNNPIKEIANKKVIEYLDYSKGINNLPKSDVLKYYLEGNCSLVIRPSGTEPKLKAYISTCEDNLKQSIKTNNEIVEVLNNYFK